MKEDESPDPMPRANRLPDLVEQSRFLSCYKPLDASFEIQSAVDYSKRTIGRLVRVDVIHNALLVVRLSTSANDHGIGEMM